MVLGCSGLWARPPPAGNQNHKIGGEYEREFFFFFFNFTKRAPISAMRCEPPAPALAFARCWDGRGGFAPGSKRGRARATNNG